MQAECLILELTDLIEYALANLGGMEHGDTPVADGQSVPLAASKPAATTRTREHRPWTHIWTNLAPWLESSMRTVNVHEAKTQFSRLIDAAHAGETILVAKDGKPWARLVPLETERPQRQPGLLRGQLQLPPIDELLAPLPSEELDALDTQLPS
jgi:prevent-host-death family protein